MFTSALLECAWKVLRSPAPSDLSSKRKLVVSTIGNQRRVSSNSKKSNTAVNVTAIQWTQEFKDESFVISYNCALFFQVCRQEFSLKNQNTIVRFSRKKHIPSKKKMGETKRKEKHIVEALTSFDEVYHLIIIIIIFDISIALFTIKDQKRFT